LFGGLVSKSFWLSGLAFWLGQRKGVASKVSLLGQLRFAFLVGSGAASFPGQYLSAALCQKLCHNIFKSGFYLSCFASKF
jgi:hypothetical protein